MLNKTPLPDRCETRDKQQWEKWQKQEKCHSHCDDNDGDNTNDNSNNTTDKYNINNNDCDDNSQRRYRVFNKLGNCLQLQNSEAEGKRTNKTDNMEGI